MGRDVMPEAIDGIDTERLHLRRWRFFDRPPFAALNADPEVMEHFPSTLTEEEQILSREVTIMADKEIPYQLLKRVMATSTAADYGQLSLAVLQTASEARLATVARN